MKYFLLAGEASGDMHGAKLIRALKKQDTNAHFFCFGGDLMQKAGGKLLLHHRHMAFMGFWEVIKNLRRIAANMKLAKQEIIKTKPDALILIDFPGFNLRIAEWAKKKGLKVFYYISPQVWAWKEKRVEKIRRTIDRLFVILPFEQAFYAKHQIEVSYVGHPLLEDLSPAGLSPNKTRHDTPPLLAGKQKLIALLPGSRKQEVQRILPVMLQLPDHFPEHHFIIAAAPGLEDAFFESIFRKENQKLPLLRGHNHALLQKAEAAVVCSGTATLETALIGTPQIVGYRSSLLSYLIARRLIKVPYISLVNLILNEPLLEELIQTDFNPDKLTKSLQKLLQTENQKNIQNGYAKLRKMLAPPLKGFTASALAAREIFTAICPNRKNTS